MAERDGVQRRGPGRIQKVRELTPIADELGVSMAQLAIAWCLKNPNVSTVITGASRVSQVEENMKAMAIVEQLDDDVMAQIEAVLDNKPEPGAFNCRYPQKPSFSEETRFLYLIPVNHSRESD